MTGQMRTYVPKGREAEELTVGKNWFVIGCERAGVGAPGDARGETFDWQGQAELHAISRLAAIT